VFIRQPGAVETDVLGGIGDGDGLLVEDGERALVIGREHGRGFFSVKTLKSIGAG
jgi:hypothetical protein